MKPFISKNVIAGLVLSCFLIASCTTTNTQETFYYTLRYYAFNEKEELKQQQAIPHSVWVRDANLSKTYRRKQIVVRNFGPRISYSEHHRWADDLEEKFADLITERFKSYNTFQTVRRDFSYTRPEYELITDINALEFLKDGKKGEAHLSIDLALRTMQGDKHLVTHSVNKNLPVYDKQLDTFVQTINEEILNITNQFIEKTLFHFNRITSIQYSTLAEKSYEKEKISENEPDYGQLLLPDVFSIRTKSLYTIIDSKGNEINAQFGEPVALKVGTYTIRYGSGNVNQKMVKRGVEITPGYKTIIKPNYGGLIIEAVDSGGDNVEISYELFDMGNQESYGMGYTVIEGTGENPNLWVLPSERYKITIQNQPYSANKNFVTVYIENGKTNIFTLVVDQAKNETLYTIVGAGVIKEPIPITEIKPWYISNSITGNINTIIKNEESFLNYIYEINLNGQLENKFRYDDSPLHFSAINKFSFGAMRERENDFRINQDSGELEVSLVYNLLFNLGGYIRGDIKTHFSPTRKYQETPFSYRFLDTSGNVEKSGQDVESVKIQPPFFPLSFTEGSGINFQFFQNPLRSMNLRCGLGLRQTLNKNVYSFIESQDDAQIYEAKENDYQTGIEGALLSEFQFPNKISYASRMELFSPFIDFENIRFEWENNFKLSLFRNLSMDYKLSIYNAENPNGKLYIGMDHGIYFRISNTFSRRF